MHLYMAGEREVFRVKKRPKRLMVLSFRIFTWALCAACFFALFALGNPFLLVLNRTSVIVFSVFAIVYVLMTTVYGGLDIGIRKSRSIIFSMTMVLFFADIAAHFFMCIMDYTVIHGGKFVYERPHILLSVFALQVILVTAMTYLGNWLFFTFKKPQNCLMIVRQGDDYDDWVAKIARFKKQFVIQKIAFTTDSDIFDQIERADAVFLYDLVESERTVFLEYAYQKQKDIFYSMELADVVMLGGEQTYFDDVAMVYAAAEKISVEAEIIKRFMDVLISLLALIITSPILLLTALAIKIEDGGTVFYRQLRATYGGRLFRIVKFRSMRPEVGDIHRSVVSDDDRITRVGRVIRKYRIDELPQLFNVLRGDMSLVGPRPEMLENMEKYTDELPQFSYRLRAKAGITGLAQVYGRYNTSPKDKLILDMIYIENYSFWLDVKILLRTALVLFTPERSTAAFRRDKAKETAETAASAGEEKA